MSGKQINFLIDFKLHKSTAEELTRIYGYFLTNYRYDHDDHLMLLSEHIKDMYQRLEYINRNILKTAHLHMNNSEALAFFQFWSRIDTSGWPLATVLICDMIKKIDLRIKQPKQYATH